MEGVDAVLMGRKTFEKVLSFDIDWPYQKKVYVLSTQLKKIPAKFNAHSKEIINSSAVENLEKIRKDGFESVYLDGRQTKQSFPKLSLVDVLIITLFAVLLGGGIPLFGSLWKNQYFKARSTKKLTDELIQTHYIKREK